jgi:hypothetical protein
MRSPALRINDRDVHSPGSYSSAQLGILPQSVPDPLTKCFESLRNYGLTQSTKQDFAHLARISCVSTPRASDHAHLGTTLADSSLDGGPPADWP